MNQFPNDDERTASPEENRLVDFLRQNRSSVPPAAPDLEERLMSKIQAISPVGTPAGSRRSLQRRVGRLRRLWIASPAIAAGLLIAWASQRALLPSQPNAAEVANLETFIENNWDGVVGNNEINSGVPNTESEIAYSSQPTTE